MVRSRRGFGSGLRLEVGVAARLPHTVEHLAQSLGGLGEHRLDGDARVELGVLVQAGEAVLEEGRHDEVEVGQLTEGLLRDRVKGRVRVRVRVRVGARVSVRAGVP